jgi:chemotaxis protein CheZ
MIETQSEDRQMLLHYVVAARRAIADMRPNDMRARRLPAAMGEIGMIVETTEGAADQIMTAIDGIMRMPEDTTYGEYRNVVEARCLSMLEACAFQDLTGQRMTKVVETLMMLEDRLGALATILGDPGDEEPLEPKAANDVLLNGPAMPGEGVNQDEIDKLFT